MEYPGDSAVDTTPMSVQELAKKAVDFEYNPQVPLRYWLRTADTILKEVCGAGCVGCIGVKQVEQSS